MGVKMNIVKIGVEPILVIQPDGAQFYDGTGWKFSGEGIEGEVAAVTIDYGTNGESVALFGGYTIAELHEIWTINRATGPAENERKGA